MTTISYKSALKSLFSFQGYKVCGILVSNSKVEVSLQKTRKTGDCPHCERKNQPVIHEFIRAIRDLDMVDKECEIRLVVYRINCRCGFCGMEDLDFLNKYSRYTNRFVDYVALLCEKMSLSDVRKIMKLSWGAVKRIDMAKLRELVLDFNQLNPKRIGVDEIAYEKGHKYLTVVRDVDLGKVIWVGKARKRETLNEFFRKLGMEKSWNIELVVCDMWEPYIASIRANTNAAIVFDKFHIAQKINGALDKIRKKEFAKADSTERKTMKKKRFLILSRQKRLNNKKRETLDDLLSLNETLYKSYLLKEQALDIFDEKDMNKGMERLDQWFRNVAESGLQQFEEVVKTLKFFLYGIRNYFIHQITNAQSEGFNTKINVIKRRAFGFRDLEYFKLKILQSCG